VRLKERFVISELTGGLGNQLFQYAAARALALREGRGLYFAWHLHRSSTQRRFMLDPFQLGAEVRREPLSRARLCWLGLRSPLADRKAGRLWQRLRGRAVASLHEQGFHYTPLRSVQDRIALDGYFQSWRYFVDQEPAIRAGLSLRAPLSHGSARLLAQIESDHAVCLHVRRGDYVADAKTAAFHGALDLGYYRRGLEALGAAAKGATLYLFSDDPVYCKSALSFDQKTVVVEGLGADRPWEDLRLMAACKHFVIANSSFSWWGAFLSTHADKRVVAPQRWFLNAEHDTRDLCPPTWMRL
jgi:hypothetical protein